MTQRLSYYRVSTLDQSIEAQRHAMGGSFFREFIDEGVSGSIKASQRPGFADLLNVARKGDTVCVYAVDRLGRDAIDVQQTVRDLLDRGVKLDVYGLGIIAPGVGELILAVLAQVAEMERRRITERTEAGRAVARASLAATGKTHRGKESLGRPKAHSSASVMAWKNFNGASISETAERFKISLATVKRYASQEKKPK